MTAKRFTYDSKTVSILKDGEFWLDGNIDTACNHSEICNELNNLADENEELKQFQEKVASVIEGKMGDNVCNNYKMEVLEEIWNELELDEVWFE